MNFKFVYILQSLKDHRLYIGFTEKLKTRMKAHAAGQNQSTKNRRPLKLIYFEGFLSEIDARRREKYFKSTKGKTTLKIMLKDHFRTQE
ncbi:GIY-YIG nuclease family protein [Candidatus Parcubacteria bacterium]|nr:MAG: GIY-YIG nuclease family protein [Candidatus Parcubacteria bacterium]